MKLDLDLDLDLDGQDRYKTAFVFGIFIPKAVLSIGSYPSPYQRRPARAYAVPGSGSQKPKVCGPRRRRQRRSAQLCLRPAHDVRRAHRAGGVAVVYALGIGLFFYRDLKLPEVWRGMRESSIDSAMGGFLIGVAAPFAWVLITGRVPQQFLQLMLTYVDQGWTVLLCLNVIMLLAGSFLELPALMLILVPLAFPLIMQVGIDPVHFGVIVVVNLMLGGLTPPYGVLVFIPAAVTGTSVGATFRAAMPFFVMLVFGLALLTYVPWISLALVHAFF